MSQEGPWPHLNGDSPESEPVDSAKLPPIRIRDCVECGNPVIIGQLCKDCHDRAEIAGIVSEEKLRVAREARIARLHNYRIIDENGVECWAGELAQRYRAETRPTPPIPIWIHR